MQLDSGTLFFLFIASLLPSQYGAEVYNITPSHPLVEGQTLVSPGLRFELGFFTLNSAANKYVGLWHRSIFPRKYVWVANRDMPIATTDILATLRIGRNGSLELVDGKQNSVWSTNATVLVSSSSTSSVAAFLSDDGNFVAKDVVKAGQPIWQSFDYPGDTMLPTQRVGYNSKSKYSSFLIAWKSESDPSSGIYTAEEGRATEMPPQVIIRVNRSTPFWRSGPWEKSKFIGVPDMDDRYRTYLDISSQGKIKLMYADNGRNWSLYWKALENPCDKYGACGPFGICKASESTICNCMKGFVPKSHQKWSKGDWTGGCVRKTELSCDRQTTKRSVPLQGKQDDNDDRFWKIIGAKVPDYYEYMTSFSAQYMPNECKTRCLNNCSCLAYAYVNNIGCLVWSKDLIDIQEFSMGGVDIYIRVANKELGEGKPIKLIASLTAIGLIIILAAIV
ncbi:hypothetical protein ACLB2K_045788 [Fragaria x ananassa]